MKTAAVDYLILELTRRCNMKCPHCLRGDAENVDMPFEIAKATIEQFDTIGSITFSGGEPTLCGEMVEKIVDYIIENEVNVQGFYMASNGKEVDLKTMFALTKLYGYIYKNYGCDYGQCVFDISLDQYHDKIDVINKGILHAFSFVSTRGEISDRGLIKEGRAYESSIGTRDLNHNQDFVYEKENDAMYSYETIYVNAKGNIYPCCDFSYQTQKKLPNICIKDGCINDLTQKYNDNIKTI